MSNTQPRSAAASDKKVAAGHLAPRLRAIDGGHARLLKSMRRIARLRLPDGAGTSIEVETTTCSPVASTAVVAHIRTVAGTVTVAFSPDHWPGLASAATMSDPERRGAIALLLISEQARTPSGFLLSVELAQATQSTLTARAVALRHEGRPFQLLGTSQEMLDAVDAAAQRAGRHLPTSASALRIPCRARIASRHFSAQTLRALLEGDVVVLSPTNGLAAPDCAATCVWGDSDFETLQARVLVRRNTMTLLETPTLTPSTGADHPARSTTQEGPLADAATATDANSPKATAVVNLERLELVLHFELQGPLLRLAEIADLAVDDVLELPMPVDQAHVRIMVARQWVGLGELVVVGERLGVRVVQMNPAGIDRSEALPA